MLGGPQDRSKRVRKISPPPGFDPLIIQPVASRYTDWAIPAHFDKSDVLGNVCTCRPAQLGNIQNTEIWMVQSDTTRACSESTSWPPTPLLNNTAPFHWVAHVTHPHPQTHSELHKLHRFTACYTSFLLKIATEMHAEMLKQLQNATPRLNSERERHALRTRRKNKQMHLRYKNLLWCDHCYINEIN